MVRPAVLARTRRLAGLLALLSAAPLAAQAPSGASAGAAAAYLPRYRELHGIIATLERVADVQHLVLTRGPARLTLERGRLFFLSPVGGRLVGAVFRGEGRFVFAPRRIEEQAELLRFADSTALDAPITEAVLLFADSTADQLRGLTPAQGGDVPGSVESHARDLVGSLEGDHEGVIDGDVMAPFLNGDTTGLFVARLERAHGDALLFEYDPALAEPARLLRPVSKSRWGSRWALVSQVPVQPPLPGSQAAWAYRERLSVPAYRIDLRLGESFTGSLGITASATLTLVAREPVGPWLRFGLLPKLDVDSARWGTGDSLATFKADDESDLWLRAPRRLAAGDSVALTVHYHGPAVDRFGNFFFVDPGGAWYPLNRQGASFSTFDLSYHAPSRFPLVSIGERTDSTVAGREAVTHWVVRRPTSYARFNLGLFDDLHVQHEGAPPLDIFISDEAHDLFRRQAQEAGYFILEQRHMRENVAADVSNALKTFTADFGPPPFDHFLVTEIPYGEGVSFPGMIDLAFTTFSSTSLDGFDEFFRAHEASHQWWGNGVRPATYRDAWLSEGLASFSGLLYLQAVRRRNNDYYRFLDQYRTDILEAQGHTGAVAIGWRNATPDTPHGYDVIVYEKGAWILHMLRVLMMDFNTMRTDRFVETLRDYYQTFHDQAAGTVDFQAVVERHLGMPMGWFFDQWVRGTAIPTYHVAWTTEPAGEGRYRVKFRIAQDHVPPEFRAYVPVAVDLGGDRVARFRLQVHGAQGEYQSPVLPGQPRRVEFNTLHGVLANIEPERW
jgi:hypothetical protein